jgi:glycosyltransferase involved in cell wall biosynthesis
MDEIKRIVLEGNYNVVHVHGNSALMYFAIKAAKNAGAQVRIAHCHNSSTQHPLVHHLIKPAFNKITTVKIGCSEKAAKWAYDKDYVIIKNGVELDDYQFSSEIRKSYREKLGLKDEFLVGHIGRFSQQKNHKFLIEIFHEILRRDSSAKLLLIGDGELEDKVREQVKALHLEDHVIFYGLSHHVKEFMQAMDVFLLPSLYEGLPIVGVEAQASGLNIVTSDTVSEELAMTPLVHYISLNESASSWADEVMKYKGSEHVDERASLKACGYDLQADMQVIKEIYERY